MLDGLTFKKLEINQVETRTNGHKKTKTEKKLSFLKGTFHFLYFRTHQTA